MSEATNMIIEPRKTRILFGSVGQHSHFRWGIVGSEQKLDEVGFGVSNLSIVFNNHTKGASSDDIMFFDIFLIFWGLVKATLAREVGMISAFLVSNQQINGIDSNFRPREMGMYIKNSTEIEIISQQRLIYTNGDLTNINGDELNLLAYLDMKISLKNHGLTYSNCAIFAQKASSNLP